MQIKSTTPILSSSDKDKAKIVAEEICKKLLTNTVIENYKIDLEQ